jgi:alkyldihydroxyacetonephosphate synthase
MVANRKYWGWGTDDVTFDPQVLAQYKATLKAIFQIDKFEKVEPVPIDELKLRAPRFTLPAELAAYCTSTTFERASHSYGKSFRDIWRGLHGQFDNPPDYIAYPKTEQEIQDLMQFAEAEKIALIPFGGGSSVTGGVEPTFSKNYAGVITIDMEHFNKILAIDKASRSAHIQGGMFGPAIEAGLKPHGLTLRHYPQSFEFSTLGGWIVTRSGGHFATLFTHIDEFVQGVRMVTPSGILESRRLPGHGAGPSEERLITGSEGIFGILTSAWMRLQDIPKYKLAKAVKFSDFKAAVEATRQLAQSSLFPTNARLVDPMEAASNGLGDGSATMVILGFESHQHRVEPWMEEALKICKDLGGTWTDGTAKKGRSQKADAWKNSFLKAPYLRDELMKNGLILETFETAVTWDQFPKFHKAVRQATQAAVNEHCGIGTVTCRFTHLYPDGPAPYYTIIAKGKAGKQIKQWEAIKKAASDAIIENGGTITHHHAVGKDHQPHYARQHSELFGAAMQSVKQRLDPNWVLNPEVLIKSKK